MNIAAAAKFRLSIAAISCCLIFAAPASSAALMDDIVKELEYSGALIQLGAENGDVNQYAAAHRALANLAVTSGRLENPRDHVLTLLAISYFYVRMCGDLPPLQLSKAANPGGLSIDCAALAGEYMKRATDVADKRLPAPGAADAHFFAGLGYDALRGYMSGVKSRDTAPFHRKALEQMKKAVELGASFDGAKAVLARLAASQPSSRSSIVSRETFEQAHQSMYMNRVLTLPPTLKYLSGEPQNTDPENTYVSYRWRFSIVKPGADWEFSGADSKSNFKLTIRQKPAKPIGKPALTLVAHELTPAETGVSVKQLVDSSVQLLTQAGYSVESQSEAEFKGNPAYEVVLASQYKDINVKDGAANSGTSPSLITKHYMFVALSGGIEYILSFNTLLEDYAKVFPDMRIIANTLELF